MESHLNCDKDDCFIVEGVCCPKQAPWPKQVSYLSLLPFPLLVALAFFILLQTSMIKLILWLSALFIFAYPLRYMVCARCPYYGQNCSTIMGRVVPLMFKKQEGKSMITGLWLDILFFFFLFLLPLSDAYQAGGFLLIFIWIMSFVMAAVFLTAFACTRCPFTFCPIGQFGRMIWKH